MKRTAHKNPQEWENGKGVGISCDDLNNNIAHPGKPHGIGSEKKFVALHCEMLSLLQSEPSFPRFSSCPC